MEKQSKFKNELIGIMAYVNAMQLPKNTPLHPNPSLLRIKHHGK